MTANSTDTQAAPLTWERIGGVMERLTTAEKISMLDGSDFWHTQGIDRLGVPALMLTDGPHGLRKQAGAADHLGLNQSVPATCFPPAAGLASAWNPELVEQVGRALGEEARAQQVSVILGPGLNIKRSPLCGRNFEYFSEDPLLGGELAGAMVRGIQSEGIGACLKHFAANNQETDRMRVSAEIDPRTLREIYLSGFERAVRAASPWTVMAAYNRINGTYVASSHTLLTDILRDDWGFDGLVMSDWGGVADRPSDLQAGLDLEMPSSSGAGAAAVSAALDQNRLSIQDVDKAVHRLLTLAARVGTATEAGQTFDADAHHQLAGQAASQAAVLLKNDGILPLTEASGGPLAVVGEFAARPRYQGAGSSAVNPTRLDTALDSIRALLGGRREVLYAQGFVADAAAPNPDLVAEAVDAAQHADQVVLFLGLPAAYESEGYDRRDLELPQTQIELLAAVAAVNPKVVVVLSNGGVVDVASWEDQTAAVVEGWLLGQAGGSATADLLFGRVSPSGKLAETIPLRLVDTPAFGNFPGEKGSVYYGERTLVGYRWYDTKALDVAYPFGHGLSYTSFEYSDPVLSVISDGPRPTVSVEVTIRNAGQMRGREVAQVYVHDVEASVERADQGLVAFASADLAPGESRRLSWLLDQRAFAFWDVELGRWFAEGGDFEVRIGASSRDIRARLALHLEGDPMRRPITVQSTANEWLADPVLGPWLESQLRGSQFEGILTDHLARALMGPTPLVRLTRFGGFPITATQAEQEVLR